MGTKITALGAFSILDPDNDPLVGVDVSDVSMAATGTDKNFTPHFLGGILARGFAQSRLTTESGVAVSTSDRTAQGTIYLTPIDAGLERVWDGTRWKSKFLTEISLALTVTSGKAYDVFYNGSALSLSSAWTNDTTRADALATQDGIKCLSSDHTKLYKGTIYASGSNITEDSLVKRYIYNEYNQVLRLCQKTDATSHTYNSGTARSWNNDATDQVDFILGSAQTVTYDEYADCTVTAASGGSPAVYALLDWTSGTGAITDAQFAMVDGAALATVRGLDGIASGQQIAAGRHYIRAVEVEFSTQTSTFTQFRINAYPWM